MIKIWIYQYSTVGIVWSHSSYISSGHTPKTKDTFSWFWIIEQVLSWEYQLFAILKWRLNHDDVIKWKHFPRYWPFVRGIHRSPVNSTHKGQWRGALMFTLICARINGWVNNIEAGDLRRYLPHYGVIVMPTVSGRISRIPHPYPHIVTMTSLEHYRVWNHWQLDCLFKEFCSIWQQRKYQEYFWSFVSGIHRWTVDSPNKGPVMLKAFAFDNVLVAFPPAVSVKRLRHYVLAKVSP